MNKNCALIMENLGRNLKKCLNFLFRYKNLLKTTERKLNKISLFFLIISQNIFDVILFYTTLMNGGQGGCRAHYPHKKNGFTVRRVCRFATYPFKLGRPYPTTSFHESKLLLALFTAHTLPYYSGCGIPFYRTCEKKIIFYTAITFKHSPYSSVFEQVLLVKFFDIDKSAGRDYRTRTCGLSVWDRELYQTELNPDTYNFAFVNRCFFVFCADLITHQVLL